MKHRHSVITLAVAMAAALTIHLSGQTKLAPAPADFGQWETLAPAGARGGLSPDGAWLAYAINRTNRNNELRVTKLADRTTKIAPFGTQPVFAADSKWIAYAIGYSEAQKEKLRKDKKPIHRKLGLLDLTRGEMSTIDGVESFAFDATGTELAMRRYAPEKAGRDQAPVSDDNSDETPGATLIVRTLATGRDTTFGNVSEYAWQENGKLLALVINAEDKTGNGVQLFDPAAGSLRVLDSSASTYTGLAWRKGSSDLAVLRSKTDSRHVEPTHAILAWANLGGSSAPPRVFEPTDGAIPAGQRTSQFRKPAWSDDGKTVYVGLTRWTPKAAADTNGDSKTRADADEEEPAGVDVWHPRDVDVMAKQKLSARNDRRRTLLAAWRLETNRLVPLATDLQERVEPIPHRTNVAYAATWVPYAMDRSIGRGAADVSLIDTTTGQRTKVKDRVDDDYLRVSPGGRYLLYFDADQYWTIDVDTRAIVNITKSVPAAFVNRQSDATVKQKPPFGVAGWTKNDAAVLLYDQFDIWQVAPDGSRATKLTDGAAEQVQHRYARLNPDEEFIGVWTKKSARSRTSSTTTAASWSGSDTT